MRTVDEVDEILVHRTKLRHWFGAMRSSKLQNKEAVIATELKKPVLQYPGEHLILWSAAYLSETVVASTNIDVSCKALEGEDPGLAATLKDPHFRLMNEMLRDVWSELSTTSQSLQRMDLTVTTGEQCLARCHNNLLVRAVTPGAYEALYLASPSVPASVREECLSRDRQRPQKKMDCVGG